MSDEGISDGLKGVHHGPVIAACGFANPIQCQHTFPIQPLTYEYFYDFRLIVRFRERILLYSQLFFRYFQQLFMQMGLLFVWDFDKLHISKNNDT